jgi:hypothetical protein
VQRQDVGITLRVEPTVAEAGGVRLKLLVETAALGEPVTGPVELVGPTVLQRSVETTVRLADAEWVVIGMGLQPEVAKVVVGTPFFKDIPVIGNLFRTTVQRNLKSQLVVAVQGRIQRTRDEALADSIRRRLGFQRAEIRTKGLDAEEDGPVALRITTRTSEAQARSVAESFETGSHSVRVLRWEAEGEERFDVLLTGFRSIADAGAASKPLAAEGWLPQIVVVPGADPEPSSIHARPGQPPTSPF